MARKKLLLLLKPFDVYSFHQSDAVTRITTSQIFRHLDSRCKVHKDAINTCQEILRRKPIDWEPLFRNKLPTTIHNVDLVVTIGGDGTLLQASHLLDDSIPVLGVNSDPTRNEEVEKFSDEFDASRSTGYLCGATVENFEQVLDKILEGQLHPLELSRLAVCVNSKELPTYALNDILIAHPCPAAVSRFSFRIMKNGLPCCPLVNSRSSGLRVSTAAGSTAAMLSAGGFRMPILSKDLQYMVREPIMPAAASSEIMHGLVKPKQVMKATWSSKEGVIYIDGSHVCHSIQYEDVVEISSNAPGLKIFLSSCHPQA